MIIKYCPVCDGHVEGTPTGEKCTRLVKDVVEGQQTEAHPCNQQLYACEYLMSEATKG